MLARGKGCEVKRSQLDDVMTTIRSTAAARGQQIPPIQADMIERMQLDQLVQVQLLNSMATPADKAKGEENANKQFKAMKTRAGTEVAKSYGEVGHIPHALFKSLTSTFEGKDPRIRPMSRRRS